jgi:hypothetical protein
MVTAMANDRLKFAIGRLERAAARVERLTAEARPVSGTDSVDPAFLQQHEKLRQQVRSAIGRIDALIGSSGQ